MRRPLIAANWKMFKTVGEAEEFVRQFLPLVDNITGVDAVICPPASALAATKAALADSAVALGGQDCFWKNEDAYTGQVSPRMLVDLGCSYVIVGHSEKRGRLGPRKNPPPPELLSSLADNDDSVNAKAKAALAEGLTPIICVGETAAERDAKQTEAVVARQVEKALNGLNAQQVSGLVMAYEPVWAIGAGTPCEPDDAVGVIGLVRNTVGRLFGDKAADDIRIQYGGTVKPDNIAGFIQYQQIDGGLVGGASLDPQGFATIMRRAEETIKRQRR